MTLLLHCNSQTPCSKDTDLSRLGNSSETGPGLAAAAGVAVTWVMFMTTILMTIGILVIWKHNIFVALTFFIVFGLIDVSFLSAALNKFLHGGWFPIALSGGLPLPALPATLSSLSIIIWCIVHAHHLLCWRSSILAMYGCAPSGNSNACHTMHTAWIARSVFALCGCICAYSGRRMQKGVCCDDVRMQRLQKSVLRSHPLLNECAVVLGHKAEGGRTGLQEDPPGRSVQADRSRGRRVSHTLQAPTYFSCILLNLLVPACNRFLRIRRGSFFAGLPKMMYTAHALP